MVNGYTAVRSALLSTSNKGSISRTYFQILQDKEHIHLPARHERKGPSFNAHVTRGWEEKNAAIDFGYSLFLLFRNQETTS